MSQSGVLLSRHYVEEATVYISECPHVVQFICRQLASRVYFSRVYLSRRSRTDAYTYACTDKIASLRSAYLRSNKYLPFGTLGKFGFLALWVGRQNKVKTSRNIGFEGNLRAESDSALRPLQINFSIYV